jgi:hypothetical protein
MKTLRTGAGLAERLQALSVHELFFWRTRMPVCYYERELIDIEIERRDISVQHLIDANMEERTRQFSLKADFQGVMF